MVAYVICGPAVTLSAGVNVYEWMYQIMGWVAVYKSNENVTFNELLATEPADEGRRCILPGADDLQCIGLS